MLVMSGLLYVTHWFLYSSITLSLPDHFKGVLDYIHVALWVLLPVTGWVAESSLGRYRAIVVGLVLSSIAILTVQVAFVMLKFDWTPIPAVMHACCCESNDWRIWLWKLLYYFATICT